MDTKEPQYNEIEDIIEKHGISSLGLMANWSWNEDPKRMLFGMSRYKFVSKILSGKNKVLEIGCADAFFTRLVQQEVGHVTAIDFDPIFIEDAKKRMNPNWPMDCFVHDMLQGPVPGSFDAIYSLDVLEHIDPKDESLFLKNAFAPLKKDGTAIFGIPSLESQVHASPQSVAGHVNCKSGKDFKDLMAKYFENTFLFCMNDEVVHTGFSPMAHYIFVVGSGLKI